MLIFWTGFYFHEYKFYSFNGFGEFINSLFLRDWETGGAGVLDLDFRGSQLLIKQVADETGCMTYPLINWFGRDVYYGSTKALFSCFLNTKFIK